MPEPNSDAEFLRRLANAHRRRAALYPQITYDGETELTVAARLETIADEIDPDTNAGALTRGSHAFQAD